MCASIEVWGRMGDSFQNWLVSISSAARARDRARGLSASRYLSKWRLIIAISLSKALCRVVDDAIVSDMAFVQKHSSAQHD